MADKKGKGSGKKDACYHKVKSRYSVWPSAYASGALVKCRKVGAKNWGNKSESFEVQDGVVEGAMPEPIDPKKHRDASKQSKINNMKKSDNPNERKVAEKKLTPAAKVDTPVTRTKKIREFSKNTEPTPKPNGPKLMGEGKYSKSETYVKGTAPVRATYGGKTESFPKETYKKKSKKVEVSEGDKYDNVGKQAARMSLLNNPSPRSTPEQTAEKKARLEKKRGMKLDDHPQFKKEEVDKRRAPAELVARLSAKREGHMAQDGPNKAAYDAKQRILKKTKEKMAEQMLSEKPYQITGPHSYTAGDGDPKDDVKIEKTPYNVGKPMKSKVRARNKVDKMNQEYGASVYRMKYVEGIEDSVQKMLDEAGKKCWKGYKKAGTQKLFGKTYNRCVKANEELSIDQQMKISRDYNRMSPEEKKAANKKAMGNVKKVAPKKDTRTDAQKMTDATGPRPGSRYRGD